jgi:hypothetical protein
VHDRADIDIVVTVLVGLSQIWDTPGSVPFMVAHTATSERTALQNHVPRLHMSLTDHEVVAAAPGQAVKVAAPLDSVLTLELDGAAFALGLTGDELLLAAFGRTVARTIGDGVVAVDVARDGRSVPCALYLYCAGEPQMAATDVVALVHSALAADADDRLLGSAEAADMPAEVLFHYVGTTPARAHLAPLRGHALELRAYRDNGVMRVDWWYDSSRFDEATIQELAEQFPFALIELTSEARPQG